MPKDRKVVTSCICVYRLWDSGCVAHNPEVGHAGLRRTPDTSDLYRRRACLSDNLRQGVELYRTGADFGEVPESPPMEPPMEVASPSPQPAITPYVIIGNGPNSALPTTWALGGHTFNGELQRLILRRNGHHPLCVSLRVRPRKDRCALFQGS
jgi:hypothetical protein